MVESQADVRTRTEINKKTSKCEAWFEGTAMWSPFRAVCTGFCPSPAFWIWWWSASFDLNALIVRSLRTSQTLAFFSFAAEVYKDFSLIFVWLGTISWFATYMNLFLDEPVWSFWLLYLIYIYIYSLSAGFFSTTSQHWPPCKLISF